MTDLLIVNSIGPGFSRSSVAKGIGGSELEVVLVAHALARRGHSVTVANGVTSEVTEEGVRYIPLPQAAGMRAHSLWIERMTVPPGVLAKRVVIRATDIYCPPYDVHRPLLDSGKAAVAVNTKWQAEGFGFAKEQIIIPPALDYDLGPGPKPKKVPGRFLFASMPMKGLNATLEGWRSLKRKHGKALKGTTLLLALPGRFDFGGDLAPPLTDQDKALGVSYAPSPSLIEYRRLIASAVGLFYVNRMPETFCCAAAFAEKYGTATHILCLNGLAGIPEALVDSSLVTAHPAAFERNFLKAWQAKKGRVFRPVPDRSPDALAPLWEKALGLEPKKIAASPTAKPSAKEKEGSAEAAFTQEDLPENRAPLGPEFGTHVSLLRSAISSGGSEMGLGLMLQALVASTRATRVVEIGRFRGFSTLALASGLALADAGWQEPKFARQRPDVDYAALLSKQKRVLVSIDPHPTKEADELLKKAGLSKYVERVDKKSAEVDPVKLGPIGVLLLDGDHTLEAMRADIARYVPHVKPGGYFVLHDYFGWYRGAENGSPIKRAIDEDLAGFERVLIDTGFASFMVFRKNIDLMPQPAKIAARADGRPTVGLVMIAIGAEASTVVARAIVSALKMVDAVTVVIDPAGGGEQTAEVAGARNEAVAIAERKTDYVLMLDADDTLEGEMPSELTEDIYELFVHDSNVVYRRMQMWKSARGFRYEGIIHETLSAAGTVGRIPGLKYMRRFGGGHQDSVPASVKYMRHARLVAKWLVDHPDDSRAQFYLAQSYRDAGRPDDAIREYEQRIGMTGGNDEERAFSAFQIARITKEQGKDPTTAYLRAYELRPSRAEALCDLAVWLRENDRKRFALAALIAKKASELPMPESEALFVEPAVYEWRALDEYAINVYWTGDKRASMEAYEKLRSRVPDWYKPHIETMLAMCKRELGE
jgi:tetratricopeptide (TPR) repeat protein